MNDLARLEAFLVELFGRMQCLHDTELERRHLAVKKLQAAARGWLARTRLIFCNICFHHSTITMEWPAGCGHRFCRRCSERWLEKSPCCPMCRATVTSGSGKHAKSVSAIDMPRVRMRVTAEVIVDSITIARQVAADADEAGTTEATAGTTATRLLPFVEPFRFVQMLPWQTART